MAKVRINVALNTTYRTYDERFLVNTTSTEAWNVESDLTTYVAALSALAAQVYEAVGVRRGEGGACTAHFDVWLENVTHPTPAAGVVVLPKGNITGCLNDEELTSATPVNDLLTTYVVFLKEGAGY